MFTVIRMKVLHSTIPSCNEREYVTVRFFLLRMIWWDNSKVLVLAGNALLACLLSFHSFTKPVCFECSTRITATVDQQQQRQQQQQQQQELQQYRQTVRNEEHRNKEQDDEDDNERDDDEHESHPTDPVHGTCPTQFLRTCLRRRRRIRSWIQFYPMWYDVASIRIRRWHPSNMFRRG